MTFYEENIWFIFLRLLYLTLLKEFMWTVGCITDFKKKENT